MPVTWTVEGDDAIVRVVASGFVAQRETLEALDTLVDEFSRCPHRSILVDGSSVTDTMPLPELRAIVPGISRLRDNGARRLAIYACSDLVYGVARAFAVFAERSGVSIGVFRSETEAMDWARSGR